MNFVDYIVLGSLAAAVIFAVMFIIRRKKQGNGCCGCGNCGQNNNCLNKKQ